MYTNGRWWDSGAGWRRAFAPIGWRLAGVRDRASTIRANRRRNIVR